MKMDREIEGAPKMDEAENTKQGVWVTNIPLDGNSSFGFTCDQAEEDDRTGQKEFVKLIRASKAGEEIAADCYPSEMWIGGSFKEHKKLKHIFMANGLFAVSGAFAEILRCHDMGRNNLYPVKLFKKDRTTAYEGEFFFLNLCEASSVPR